MHKYLGVTLWISPEVFLRTSLHDLFIACLAHHFSSTTIMLSSPLGFLSLVLGVVGYVNASPSSSADPLTVHSLTNAAPCTQPEVCNPPTINCSSESDIDTVLATYAPNVSVFWGGRYPADSTNSTEPKAVACAQQQTNGATIGMVLCQHDIKMPKNGSDQLWAFASKKYAEYAKGKALVTLGASLFEPASFFNIELPALIKNTKVTSIISVDVGSKDFKELCYWHCANGKACPVGIISYHDTAISNFI